MEHVQQGPTSPPPPGALKVLVVDDSSTNRLILSRTLEALGCVIETAPSGEEAVSRLADGAFDLVLMDVQMPGIGGVEAARRIRSLDGAVAGTPIIAVTADASEADRAVYAAAGMSGVAPKPLTPGGLQAEIARVLAN